MATTTSITSTYAGQFSGKYIAAALLSAPTLDKEYITIKPNIKYKEVIKKYSNTAIVQNATCDFDPTSTVTLTETILQPEEFQVNLQLCKTNFRSDWEALEMGISIYDHLPPTFTDFMIGQVAAQVAQQIEQNIWTGSSAVNGNFPSLTELFLSGSTLGSNQVITGSWTAANNVTGSTTVLVGLQQVVNQKLIINVRTFLRRDF